MDVGIDKINCYIPPYYVDLRELARARNQEEDKFIMGIGQERMAIAPFEQDIVAMAANAAYPIVNQEDKETIDMIIFATESSFDYSKAAATFIHDLLSIQAFAKSFEIKQACYSLTAAIQLAADYVRLRPDRKVLVVSADISRYGLNTSGEVTQGAGALAMLISSQPSILKLNMESLAYTANEYDFWRPFYRHEAIVEGKFSTELYIEFFQKLMHEFELRYADLLQSIDAFHFHLPYSKMGCKSLKSYFKDLEKHSPLQDKADQWQEAYQYSIMLGKQVGNIYTGSLYLSLISSLIYNPQLKAGDSLALFSYGSGAVAEILLGSLQAGFDQEIDSEAILNHFDRRKKLSIDEYETMYRQAINNMEGQDIQCEQPTEPGFYLEKVENHQRIYKYQSKKNK